MADVENHLSKQIADQKSKSQIFKTVIEAASSGNEIKALNLLQSFTKEDADLVNSPLVKFLPEYKESGYCLLHIAAMNFMSELIKRLYKIGAKPNCFDGNGNSPLDFVLKSNRFAGGGVKPGMKFTFVEKDSKEKTWEEKAKKEVAIINTQNKRMDALESLLEKNEFDEVINVNRVSYEGTSPIGLAILNGFYEAAEYLYKKGAVLKDSDKKFAAKSKEGQNFLEAIAGVKNLDQSYSQVTTKLDRSKVIAKKTPAVTAQPDSSSNVSNMIKKFSTPIPDWNSSGRFSAHPQPTVFTQAKQIQPKQENLTQKNPVTRDRSATVGSKAIAKVVIPKLLPAEDPEIPKKISTKGFK